MLYMFKTFVSLLSGNASCLSYPKKYTLPAENTSLSASQGIPYMGHSAVIHRDRYSQSQILSYNFTAIRCGLR
jgi:hypothetical protein